MYLFWKNDEKSCVTIRFLLCFYYVFIFCENYILYQINKVNGEFNFHIYYFTLHT